MAARHGSGEPPPIASPNASGRGALGPASWQGWPWSSLAGPVEISVMGRAGPPSSVCAPAISILITVFLGPGGRCFSRWKESVGRPIG